MTPTLFGSMIRFDDRKADCKKRDRAMGATERRRPGSSIASTLRCREVRKRLA